MTTERMTAELKYPRILLKLSGEALAGEKGFGYDFDAVGRFADEIVARDADRRVASDW